MIKGKETFSLKMSKCFFKQLRHWLAHYSPFTTSHACFIDYIPKLCKQSWCVRYKKANLSGSRSTFISQIFYSEVENDQ